MFKVVVSREASRLASHSSARIFPNSQWECLTPSFILDKSERSNSYCLELLSICRGVEPGLTRDHGHAWVRLVEPTGEVYSVGFYPDESTRVEPDEVPGLRMPGMLLSPDKYEKHYQKGWNLRTVRHEITCDDFYKVKNTIENMQLNRLHGSLAFDLCEHNCVHFVMCIAKLCGINPRGATSLSRMADDLMLRGSVQRIRHRLSSIAPSVVTSFLHTVDVSIRSVLFNTALGLLGGFSTLSMQWSKRCEGQPVLEHINHLSPVFSSYRQVFSKKVPFYHVREFRQWQREVNQQVRDGAEHV
ncbi:hypothetical protein ACVBE9_05910 [Eionea flava]